MARKKEADGVTLTKDELEKLISARLADEKMDPGEKKVRTIVRDEIKSALGEFFSSADDEDEDDEDEPDEEQSVISKLFGLGS